MLRRLGAMFHGDFFVSTNVYKGKAAKRVKTAKNAIFHLEPCLCG